MTQPGFQATGDAKTWDDLFAGSNILPVTKSVTIVTGQNVVRGQLLGLITASQKYMLSASGAADGSQLASGLVVAAENIDATAADKRTTVYETGEFNENKIVLGVGWTLAALKALVGGVGKGGMIFLRGPKATTGIIT